MRTRDELERLIAGCKADIDEYDDLVRRRKAERCLYYRELRSLPMQDFPEGLAAAQAAFNAVREESIR